MGRGTQQKRRAAARGGTRAQRRAEERSQAKRVQQQKRGLPMPQIIGGVVTVLVVLGIVIYAVMQSNSHKTTTKAVGKPVTTVTALQSASKMLPVGTKAPDFTLKGVDGKMHSLSAQRGHPVFLEFFAVWCPHCQHMGSIINNLYKQYGPKGVRFYSILANPYGPQYDISYGQDTTPATLADVKYFAKTYHESVPQLIDPNFHTVNQYQIPGYPGLYVVDKKGTISYSNSGEQTQSSLSTAIQSALNGKS